jgi:hypothetical protein
MMAALWPTSAASRRTRLRFLVDADPFVMEKVVEAEIFEITPAKSDERLRFMSE